MSAPAPAAPAAAAATVDPDLFVSVVAPLRDDADIVAAFVAETLAMLRAHYANYELVLVDDGSTDATVAVVTDLLGRHDGLRLIRLSRSFGSEIAISAGLESAIGDYVAVMLPDSDPPALVPQMVEQARAGAGIVFGIRRSRAGEPFLLRAGTAAFYWLCNRVFRLHFPRDSTHFRVLSRQAVNAILQIRDGLRYLRTLGAYVGYANESITYDLLARRARPRRKTLGEALRLAFSILVANSFQPLYLAVALGLLLTVANVCYLGYVVAVYLFKPHVAEGWTTQSLVMGGMFGALSLILTVIAAYLGRLLAESRDRPLYYVLDERTSALPLETAARRNVVAEAVRE